MKADFPSAFLGLIGVIYAMNLMDPLKRTYEFIQHGLDAIHRQLSHVYTIVFIYLYY